MIYAVDPGSTHTGVAALDGDELVVLAGVSMFKDEPERSLSRVVELLRPAPRDALLGLEEVPPTARADTGHAKQARIGYRQGYVAGLVAGWWLAGDRCPPVRLTSADWRPAMLARAAAAGVDLERPRRGRTITAPRGRVLRPQRAPAGGWDVRWEGCAHVWHAADLPALCRKPDACPECHRTPDPDRAAADAIRDAWKATACTFVGALWPRAYAVLLEDARRRARATTPEHRLAGVADACEAVGIAVAIQAGTTRGTGPDGRR